MATAAKILDQHRFEARARVMDVLALGLLLIAGFFLMVEMYRLGNTLAQAAAEGGQLVAQRDARFVVVGVEGCIVALALGWISYRLFSGRRLG